MITSMKYTKPSLPRPNLKVGYDIPTRTYTEWGYLQIGRSLEPGKTFMGLFSLHALKPRTSGEGFKSELKINAPVLLSEFEFIPNWNRSL